MRELLHAHPAIDSYSARASAFHPGVARVVVTDSVPSAWMDLQMRKKEAKNESSWPLVGSVQ